ncbi:hypothetical protein [Rufibacter quisquiliarum]|uniref:Uncharacterized protein n=1 Tax=Rufibacter quisquiliarum TaxID=1549639 RepID=A0A839GZ49_9BACT|nr:hypothetical protein [Rufibacter quisquiliarum]MBA9078941.1 hypothetical protein [Rufibacter quisquiliarum]
MEQQYKNITKEEIAKLKEENGGKVKEVEVDGNLFLFKQPSRATVKAANKTLVQTKSPDDYANIIIANCLLNSKDIVDNDDETYFTLQSKVDWIVTSKVAEVKN